MVQYWTYNLFKTLHTVCVQLLTRGRKNNVDARWIFRGIKKLDQSKLKKLSIGRAGGSHWGSENFSNILDINAMNAIIILENTKVE